MLVTHNLGEGLELCDRVMIQNRGELVFQALGEHLAKRFAIEHLFIDCPNPA